MKQTTTISPPSSELRGGLRLGCGLFWFVGVFSAFANVLMLTGPLFMLQVYDRVLASRSEATLVALFALVVLLYGLMAVLDHARGRILARVGARFQSALDGRVFDAVLRRSVHPAVRARPATGLRDLEAIQRLLSSPALIAFYDLPWTPLFVAAIFLFHPWLGWLAIAGGAVLIVVTVLNQILSKPVQAEASRAAAEAESFAETARKEAETVQALGMRSAILDRWQARRGAALAHQINGSDISGGASSFSKSFRFLLQSAMLALGAYLVLLNQLSPGAMIAGSILLGRALAPVDQSIAQWAMVQRARQGWTSLNELLKTTPPEPERTALARPDAVLTAKGVTVIPPGERAPSLRGVSFAVQPGEAVAVIGPSAAGKSTLARAVIGLWPVAQGEIRLGRAELHHYPMDVLGGHIGYLPQDVALFAGTVAENIARMTANPDAKAVIHAAEQAGAHDLILGLPEGYDTPVLEGGQRLSGGQRQRIGLARAFYGDPVLLVLDEPNANLDADGTDALNTALMAAKTAGKAILIMAHRPAAIAACDTVLILGKGQVQAFGPRDDVLKRNVRNHAEIAPNVATLHSKRSGESPA